MSIDFTGVTAVAIPEGNVMKIARKSDGVVLWEKPASGDLPAGYTRLKYIQFSGEQAVDTGVIPDYNTKIESVFERETAESRYLYGVLSTNHTASVTAYLSNTSGYWRFCAAGITLGISQNTKHTAIQSAVGVTLDGTLRKYSGVSNVIAPRSLVLGSARNTSGGLESTFFIGRIYEFLMYDGNTRTADYIPCMNPDGVYGFWDKVSRSFKASITGVGLEGGEVA